MALPFNVGEISARLRRALSVRGRMPLDLDERVAIQITGLDAAVAPWRQDGCSWQLVRTITAVAAQFPEVTFFNTGPSAVGFTQRATISQLVIANPNAAVMGACWQVVATIQGHLVDAWASERNTPTGVGGLAVIGKSGVSSSVVSAVGNAFPLDGSMGFVQIPGNDSIVVPVDITLCPGSGLTISGIVAAQQLIVTAQGTVWNGEGFALT